MHRIEHSKRIILINYLLCFRFEFFIIIFCPPVSYVADFIILCSLIIKRVSDFMTNHHTNAAIVKGIIGIQIEIRGL